MELLPACGWGALAASSLVLGAVLGVLRKWPDGLIGAILAFGAGALISSVAFELAEKGIRLAGGFPVAVGLAAGALAFFVANRLVEGLGGRVGNGAGLPLALGALLDGIPEQAVLGIGIAGGEGVSVALLAAVFISNLPEAIGSAADMTRGGWTRRKVLLLWLAVAVVCTLATVGGNAVAAISGPPLQAGVNGFAAGALLVMLTDEMVPEARRKAKDYAGLATVFGFAVAAGLSVLSA